MKGVYLGGLKRSVELVDTGGDKPWVPDQATYEWSDLDFGAVHSKRVIAVAAAMQSTSNASALASANIGGVSASVITQDDFHYTAIAYAKVPAGSTGDVSLTIDHVNSFIGFPLIYIYRIIAKDPTPLWSGSYNQTSSPTLIPLSDYIYSPLRGSMTVAVGQNNRNSPATWGTWYAGETDATGMVEDSDNTGLMNSGAASCAHRGPGPASGGTWKVSYATPGGSGSGNRRGVSVAVWN